MACALLIEPQQGGQKKDASKAANPAESKAAPVAK